MRVESSEVCADVRFEAKSQLVFASWVSTLIADLDFQRKFLGQGLRKALNLSKDLAINQCPNDMEFLISTHRARGKEWHWVWRYALIMAFLLCTASGLEDGLTSYVFPLTMRLVRGDKLAFLSWFGIDLYWFAFLLSRRVYSQHNKVYDGFLVVSMPIPLFYNCSCGRDSKLLDQTHRNMRLSTCLTSRIMKGIWRQYWIGLLGWKLRDGLVWSNTNWKGFWSSSSK